MPGRHPAGTYSIFAARPRRGPGFYFLSLPASSESSGAGGAAGRSERKAGASGADGVEAGASEASASEAAASGAGDEPGLAGGAVLAEGALSPDVAGVSVAAA